MEFVESVGFAAAFLTTLATVPQVYKSWKTHHTADLSWGWLILVTLGISVWFVYGVLTASAPVLAANGASFLLMSILCWLKLNYDSEASK